jgi:N-acetyl sugar amidotransferase
MDNLSDTTIKFNSNGNCNYCNDALVARDSMYFPGDEGKKKLEAMFAMLKEKGKGKPYDCMVGFSGGLDSSYVCYLAYQYGLRVLAIHIDDGSDALVTTSNIHKICDTFKFDLIVEQPDKEQFADLTRAFILAGLPDIAIPQDNVLFACIYKYAQKNGIKYMLSGENFTLENITQPGFDASDKVHIIDVHKKFGRIPLNGKLPLYSIFEKRFKYKFIHNIQTLKPLYFVDYNAQKALTELNDACGYEYYGNKHWESRFTKFMQVYYLPNKFNIDKRKAHYSSLVISGQMSRDEAIAKLQEPQYDEVEMQLEIDFVLSEIGMKRTEFDRIMKEKPRKHSDFKTSRISKLANITMKIRKKILGY